jgi:DNA-binding NarL/FixJ family response regulator
MSVGASDYGVGQLSSLPAWILLKSGMPMPLTVIIADDDPEDRSFLRESLRLHTKLEVIEELPNGAEALRYVSGAGPYHNRALHPLPNLLIIDAVMPAFNATEILDYLKVYPTPKMKIIIYTGYPVSDIREEYLRRGANGFFYKTGQAEQLQAIVREIEASLINGDYDK